MKTLRHWKIASCLLGLVLFSALAGALLGHRAARREIEQRNDPENWNEHVVRVFDHLVKPTPEQGERIQARLDQAVRELQAIRLETISRSTNVILRLVDEVDRELTPEQRKAFATMKPKPEDLSLEWLKVKPPRSGN